MGNWGILRRRSTAKSARTIQRKPQDSLSSRCYRGLRIEQFEERALLSIGTWSEIGPAPIYDGDTVTVAPVSSEGDYLNEVAGAITAVLAHPTNADILYVGTANGGVWRTANATAASPTWTALTDNMESLSIGSLAFDTTDTSYQTIVAGIAKLSDASRAGGVLNGLLYTSDGGGSWTQLDGDGLLDGKSCTGVAARGNTILVAVDNSKSGGYGDVGIYRSTDGGTTFAKVSSGSGGTTGLPGGIAYDLAADPTNSKVFYTAIVGADNYEGSNGIYKTTDTGATWTKVSSLALDAFLMTSTTTTTTSPYTTVGVTHRVQITVGNSGQVYVGIVNAAISASTQWELDYDQLVAVYRSGDGGTTWTAMDLPKAVEDGVSQAITFERDPAASGDLMGSLPSGQGTVHFSIVADPTNANIVYIGGDAQMTTTATSSSSTALLFRGNASLATGKQWTSLTGTNTASGSTPHAESRDMTFDANGRLIEVDDGGIYLRTTPTDATGDWYSLNGDLQITEITSIAYDTISNVVIAGTQDNGVAEQTASDSSVWREVTVGDGGDVAVVVDDASLAATGESYRYSSGAYLDDFTLRTIDAANNVVATVKPALIVIGTGKMTFAKFDGGQYDTPIAINAVDPSRLVIGGALSAYESSDRGATLNFLYEGGGANAMVYGGYIGTTAYVNVLWVATDDGVYLRTTGYGMLEKTNYSGGAALDIVVDPTNWKNAYVIDKSHVYVTTDAGESWTDITGIYAASGLRSLEYISSGSTGAVLVGGDQGVYRCQADSLGTWYALGADLPNAAVYDMDYDVEDDVLVIGTLGRGAWTLEDVRNEIFGTPRLLSVGLDATVYTSKVSPTLTTTPSEVILTFNDGQTIDASTLSGIQVTSAGENGLFYDAETNPYDTDDVVIDIGYVGIGDNPNEVVLRFSSTLADGSYHITLVGQGSDGEHLYYGPDGKVVAPLTNSAGVPIGFGDIIDPDTGEIYQDGVNYVWSFTLTLAPEVTAVVPQPITRASDGTLSQARNQIEVYFSQDMDAASAETLAFYQLISTQDTANTSDDVVFHPTSAVYNSATKMVTLTFAKDQSGTACSDLASLITSASASATGAFRLRVGNEYRAIVTTERSNLLGNDGADVASTFGGAWDLGSFTYTANTKTGQSWVVSGEVAAVVDYDLQWPGGQDDVGSRSLPEGATDVTAESHSYVDSGDTGNESGKAEITTYYYNFKSDYGVVDGSTLKNEVTETQKQRIREIYSLFTQYFGVQFIESADQGITFAVGDLRALDPSTTNDGGAAGMAGGSLAIVNSFYDWGNCVYGSSFMSTAMHEIAHCLGFMHSYDVAVSEIMGDSGSASTTSSESTFPGNVDINTGLYLYRADSMDVDMYKFTVDQTGTFSAEAIAQQLENASLLDTSIILYDANGNVIASNDDYYDDDSYLTVDLKAGTYYVGVSASGTTYDATEADSGIGGTTQGKYELRLNFTPKDNVQLTSDVGIALDGDTDGTAGGAYNFWFNVQTKSDDNTSPLDTDGHDNLVVPGGYSSFTDGQYFSLSDSTTTVTFEFDTSGNGVSSGRTAITLTSTANSASKVAAIIAEQINAAATASGLAITAQATADSGTVKLSGTTIQIEGLRNRTIFVDKAAPTTAVSGWVKASASSATCILPAGHGLVSGKFDISWSGGTRYTVNGTIVGNVLTLQGGNGADFVATGTTTVAVCLTDGTLAHPYTTIDAAVDASTSGDIIRVVGNNFANDNGGDGIIAVAGSQLVDGQKFKISDATTTYVFELDSNNKVTTGNIRVAFTATDNAATVAKAIAAAINSISWIPTGLGTTTSARYAGGIYANATVSGDTVYVDGHTVTIDLGATKLKTTLQDNKAYEIGVDPLGNTLADGKKLEVPQGVTLMFDAGAVVKLRNANIDVGSSTVKIDRSEGAVQVLGTPDNDVWFTSYLNERIGTDSYTNTTSASAGDWGGLVFRNDYDYDEQEDDLTRIVLEQEGIFLDYVNNANISYGGGKVTVNGVTSVYDPIHMNEARPTVTYCTITNSADAAMSADPNSLLESQLHDSYGESVYTLDYNRVGPQLHGNTVADNSLNALFLRVTTEAGSSTETLDVAARYDDTDLVLALPENLTIAGDAGGAVAVTGTCPLTADGNSGIAVCARSELTDGDYFVLSDGPVQIRFEFDLAGNGVKSGTTEQPNLAITVPTGTSTAGIATLIAAKINAAATTYGLKITATAAGSAVNLSGTTVKIDGLTGVSARLGGRLMIDPGAIVKLSGTRIEVGIGAELIAEGTASDPIVFTSLLDDTYGAGSTFDTTNNDAAVTAAAGNWGGIYFSPTSTGSIDYIRMNYAGGSTAIEGRFATFAPIEIRQATVRVADSLFQDNTCSTTDDRNGRGSVSQSSVIYVLFSQPVIVNNTIRDNTAAAVCIDVNALNADNVADWGRSTGEAAAFDQYADNYGALVRGNLMTNNSVNGMVVRGGALTTEGIWDDTDIVHVVYSAIDIPNLSTYGGLRLQSSATASLVVKFSGHNATITAGGSPLEIEDRIGGTLQVIGTAAHPVVLTSLADDSVSAGYDPDYNPLYDTNNDGASTGTAGNWAGLELTEYSNDRNVAIILESEQSVGTTIEANGTTFTSQSLGQMASNSESGDETLRLGFEVEGEIDPTRLTDADVYSFVGYAGTEVWVTFDETTFSLDTFVELIDADGNVVASSDNWRDEAENSTLLKGGNLGLVDSDWGYKDNYSINPRNAGMRVVLPGVEGTQRTYYLRVTSKDGATSGHYQMQVKLSSTYEHPGSTVRYATIKYATNGISVYGQPDSSPLTSDVYDTEAPQNTTIVSNDTIATAQDAGNLLRSDNGSIDITGYISNYKDVDWYEFTATYGDSIQHIAGLSGDGSVYPVTIDVDYAAGMSRADIIVWVFDASGTLILKGDQSNITDDNSSVLEGTSYDDLTAGSSGTTDAYIGPIYLMEGKTYYIAVTTVGAWATASTDTTIRWEPVDSVQRIAEDNIGSENNSALAEDPVSTLFEGTTPIELNTYASDFYLGDVTFYVLTDTDLYTVDPYTGTTETDVTDTGLLPETDSGALLTYGDIVMRNDGELYDATRGSTSALYDQNQTSGLISNVNTGDARTVYSITSDGLITYGLDGDSLEVEGDELGELGGVHIEAMAITDALQNRTMFLIGNTDTDVYGATYTDNLLYICTESGTAYDSINGADGTEQLTTNVVPLASLITGPQITTVAATDTSALVAAAEDLLDGTQVAITDESGDAVTFEFDCGPDVDMGDGVSAIRDGMTFTVNGKTFEFDGGPVMVFTTNAGGSRDGETFTVTDAAGQSTTFEFDTNNKLVDPLSGNIAVKFGVGATARAVASAAVAAINANTTIKAALGTVNGANTLARVSLINDNAALPTCTNNCVTIEGSAGANGGGGAVLIPFEETWDDAAFQTILTAAPNKYPASFGQHVVDIVNANVTGVTAAYADRTAGEGKNDRLTFNGATTFDLTGMNGAWTLRNGATHNATTYASKDGLQDSTSGNVIVEFNADDTSAEIAQKLAQAITAAGVANPDFTAAGTASGGAVQLTGLSDTVAPTADDPLKAEGEGSGGKITGMAFLDGKLYCVSENGGLYEIVNYDVSTFTSVEAANGGVTHIELVNPDGAHLRYIGTVETAAGDGVEFAGLTLGPQNVEDGMYADMFFGVSRTGSVYALAMNSDQTEVYKAPVFSDGATSIDTGLTSVSGLAFSTLDYNLWHVTNYRGGDDGHDTNTTYDQSRIPTAYPINGGTSYYFGIENPTVPTTISNQPDAMNYYYTNSDIYYTYDFAGGAYGSLSTETFDLTEYTANDCPTLYFEYYLDLGGPTDFDSARVFASVDGVSWVNLLADPTSGSVFVREGNISDSNGEWLQKSISLAQFAGMSDVRLRFDFTTAGDMHVGDSGTSESTTGAYLEALAGNILVDGDTYSIDGQVFEFDMGMELDLPSAAGDAIADGETFTIQTRDAGGTLVTLQTFEFDNNPAADGTPTVTPGNVAIPIALGDTTTTVAARIADIINKAGLVNIDGLAISATIYENRVLIDGAEGMTQSANPVIELAGTGCGVYDADSIPVVINSKLTAEEVAESMTMAYDQAFADGYVILAPEAADIADGDTFSITDDNHTTVVFEFDTNGALNDATARAVDISAATSAAEVASAIASAITASGLNITTTAFDGGYLRLEGAAAYFTAGTSAVAGFATLKRDGSMLHVIDHAVDYTEDLETEILYSGVLPYSNELTGDHPSNPTYPFDRFCNFGRGQDNDHEGFYIDNIIVGFTERGQMATQASPGETTFAFADTKPKGVNTEGYYTVEIRKSEEYAVWPVMGTLVLTDSIDTNDRCADEYTLTASAANDISNLDTFNISDGVTSVTFQFVDSTLKNGNPNYVPVYFSANQTAAEVAATIVTAIHTLYANGTFDVDAYAIETGSFVYLHGAASVASGKTAGKGDIFNSDIGEDEIPSTSSDSATVVNKPLGFDGDTSAFGSIGDATPTGTSYLVYDDWGGTWYDAEKSASNTEDDDLCWAATASNVLAWTGWGSVLDLYTTDEIFQYFQDYWTDAGSFPTSAWVWWFQGWNPTEGNGASLDVKGGADFYSTLNVIENYIQYEEDTADALPAIDKFLNDGCGVGLGVYSDAGMAHAITAWGFTYDESNPDYYTGVYVTDSDDDKGGDDALAAPDELHYYAVKWSASEERWYLQDYYGMDDVYIGTVSGLLSRQVGVSATQYTDTGDKNLVEDQGQIILECNTILDSANYGIVVAASRTSDGVTTPGSPGVLAVVNSEELVPGVVIENNVIAYGGDGGIHISGNVDEAGESIGSTAIARVVNNTICGGLSVSTSQFDITLILGDGLTDSQKAVFEEAASRWESIIVGDVPDVITAEYGAIDDIVIDASGVYIDGSGGILGQAGPTMVRSDSYLPCAGIMQFDTADLADMEASGQLVDVITHEMSHVLGFGTIWSALGLLVGADGDDPQFTGAGAAAEYSAAFGLTATSVPVENTGGGGTRNSHWRESVFNNELLTGWLNAGNNPLSRMSAASMGDLGYVVDLSAADSYPLYGLISDSDSNESDSVTGELAVLDTPFILVDAEDTPDASVGGIGILVDGKASASILNNVVVNSATGIKVGYGCGTTVIGTTAYAGNGTDLTGAGETFGMHIESVDSIFVDAENGNFYPAANSPIIDSSLDSLADRESMTTVRDPLGIDESPILTPTEDLFGQLRVDDPSVSTPTGLGKNTYKDRGAVDRVDFDGPTASLASPVDNDTAGVDRDSTTGDVLIAMVGDSMYTQFDIQLSDSGSGIDDTTVTSDVLTLYQDGIKLNLGQDYFFRYDATNDRITLIPAAGIWTAGSTYTINLTTDIKDVAGTSIQPNRTDSTTRFSITLAGYDFGDAPMFVDAAHSVSATEFPEGAMHLVVPGVYLGKAITDEADATVNSTATGDSGDDGVVFEDSKYLVSTGVTETASVKTITVTASTAGFVNAWIDWNGDGVFDPTTEKISFIGNSTGAVVEGENTLTFAVPQGLTNIDGMDVFSTYMRVRFSTTGHLTDGTAMLPTGEASDGEVEDYIVSIIPTPGTISGSVSNDFDGDGTLDAGEPGLGGWTVYIDANGNGRLDYSEASTTTAADGSFTLVDVIPGVYTIREIVKSGWEMTDPFDGYFTATVTTDHDTSGNVFLNHDLVAPLAVSIEVDGGSGTVANPTNAATVYFTVTFSEPVTGVDVSDFALVASGGITGASIQDVTANPDGSYRVTVATGEGGGTLQLKLVDNDSIVDLSGNKLGGDGLGNGDLTGPALAIDKVVPTPSSITLVSASLTNAASAVFNVTFSESVTGVDSNDFEIVTTGSIAHASIQSIVLSNGVYVVTVATGTGDGTLQLNLVNDGSITDVAGNSLGGDLAGPSCTIDKTAPVVASIKRNDSNPTTASTVGYTVTFSESVTGVDVGDFIVTVSGPAGYSITSVTGSGTTYIVTVKTGSGDGTLRLDVNDNNSIGDAAGNKLGGSATHDGDYAAGEVYTIDRTHPTTLSLSNSRVAETAPTGTVVGVLSSTGPHSGAYTYELVSGTGSDGNASFRIVGGYLVTNATFDYDAKSSYQIRVRTTDSAGYSLDQTFTISVIAQAATISIGDLVWNDADKNGLQGSTESGVAGAVVELFCSPTGVIGGVNDYSLGQTVTDGNGNYEFDGLLANLNYYLVFRSASGYTFTTANVGADDTLDSDVGSTGRTSLFTLTASSTAAVKSGFDAGLVAATATSYDFASALGSTGADAGRATAADSDGNVYVVGTFNGTVDFDLGAGAYSLTSAGGADVYIAKYSSSGALLWARAVGGAGDDSAAGITLTADGNVAVAGSFQGTADFLSGDGSATLTSAGSYDVFVLELDSAGGFVWAKGMGGAGDDVANAIAVDVSGNVYTTGYFQGTADFNPDAGSNTLTAIGPKDVFVSKLNAAGGYVWAERMGGTGWSQGTSIGNGIAVAADGNVYVIGSFQGTADFDASAAVSTLTCAGSTDVFLVKLTSAGGFGWVRGIGGSSEDYGTAVAVTADGNVAITGGFQGTVDFDPGTATYNLDSAGYRRLFVAEFESDGDFAWADGFGGTGWDLATGIAVDAAGNVYATGGFWGAADFNPGTATYTLTSAGQKDAFLLKLDTNGNFAWVQRTAGGTGDDCGYGVAIATNGAIYTTGYFNGTADFDPTSSTYSLTSAGGQDAFLSKFATELTVTINQGAAQTDPTLSTPVVFRVVFSAAVSDFTAADLTLGGTAAGTRLATITPVGTDGTTYDVSVTGMTGSGTVTAAIAADKAHSTAGKANTASTSTDNSVTYSVSKPVVSGIAVADSGSSKNGILEPTDTLTVTWVATAANGIASQTVKVDGTAVGTATAGSGSAYYCSVGSWALGDHTVVVTTTDALGVSTSANYTFTVVPSTVTAPVVAGLAVGESGSSNKNGKLEPTDSLTLTWAAESASGIASQTVTIDGKAITPVKAASSPYFYCSIGTWSVGTYTVKVTTTDTKGVSTSANYTFTIVPGSSTAPVVSGIAVGESGSSNKNGKLEPTDKLTVTWRATATKGIASQTVTVDGKTMSAAKAITGTSNFYCSIGTWAIGTHTVKVTTTDKAGVRNSASKTFSVVPANAGAAPVLTGGTIGESGSSDKDNILEPTDKLTLTWSATAANGIASQVVTVGSKVIGSGNLVAGTSNYWCSLGTWAAGTYNVTIKTTDKAGLSSSITKSFTVDSALTVDASTAADGSADAVTDAQVAAIADAAAARLESQLGSQVASTLAGVTVKVANLPAGILGEASGNTIWIDDDAAGYGWFVDATPGDDAEYTWTSSTTATAVTSVAANRADLLTAVMHEMGHVLGYDHSASTDLMSATLPLSERRVLADNKSELMAVAAADSLYNSRPTSTSVIDDLFASFNDDDKKSWL